MNITTDKEDLDSSRSRIQSIRDINKTPSKEGNDLSIRSNIPSTDDMNNTPIKEGRKVSSIRSSILSTENMNNVSKEEVNLNDKCADGSGNHTIMSEKMEKLLGVTAEEMKNWHAMQRLGITYKEYRQGNEIFESEPVLIINSNNKVEKLTGSSIEQIKRAKAVNVLGTTEEEIYEIRAMKLGHLGRNNSC